MCISEYIERIIGYAQPISIRPALISFDYLLTLDREKQYIWPRGLCSPSILYYSLRYVPISYAIGLPFFLSPISKSKEVCPCALSRARVGLC